jgi:DNA polymerase
LSAAADPSRLAESLLAFWADAGVGAMLLDAPIDRIAAGRVLPPPRPTTSIPVAPVAVRPNAGQADISGAVAQAQALAAAAADLDALVAAVAALRAARSASRAPPARPWSTGATRRLR